MRVLLVEPDYRRNGTKPVADADAGTNAPRDEETLWYPPLGLMKLSRFHKDRGDEVRFVRGCDASALSEAPLFSTDQLWDRVYITTLFTFHFHKVVETIRFYLDAVGGTASKVFVGGIMASVMPKDVFDATGIYPVVGILRSPKQVGLEGKVDIDQVAPDYTLLDGGLYAINDTYYAYTTRGCTNTCPWCGVPRVEPGFHEYIDIKPVIRRLRDLYGDKAALKLMDNNVLASPHLEQIVTDLVELGYGRGQFTKTQPKKQRVIDFNQGLDATHVTERNMRLLSQLNIKPMRIAFDRVQEKKQYVRALEIAHGHGVPEFSNYMLYNFRDTPRDLYDRLVVNVELNERWLEGEVDRVAGKIYSYPMRYAPIDDKHGDRASKSRDVIRADGNDQRDWQLNPAWTRRFIRNIEIMKGAAHGAISPTPTLAKRTIGATFEEFLANLYMPEELIRNRNKHERRVYRHEPDRKPGTGQVEEFREFICGLLKKQDERFWEFHNAVSPNTAEAVRKCLQRTRDREFAKWLKLYLTRWD